jgi:hypothetical protein
MSYCRFSNTLMDLEDCREALENMMDHGGQLQGFREFKKRWIELHEIKDHDEKQEEEFEAVYERMEEIREDINPLSDEEYNKAKQLLALCKEIAEEYDSDCLIKDGEFDLTGEHDES